MVKKFSFIVVICAAICLAASFSPNSDAGMVSISIDGTSLQNLLSVYENSGYHDFGTTEKLENVDEIKTINEYYFSDWKIDLSDNDLKFDMDGVLDAKARKEVVGIPFHPHVKTSGISAAANAFFKDFGLSSDGRIHLSVCISDADVDVSNISYGYGYILNKLVIEGIFDADDIINSNAQAAVDNALVGLADATNCIDVTNQVSVGFPEFTELMGISHAGTKVENNKILAYGCPVEKIMVGDVVAVGDNPCGTVAYNVYVYTAGDIGNAGTDSKVKVSLCGDDVSEETKCIPTGNLNDWTEKGQTSHLLIENSTVLVENLSVTLESDNTGKKSGWYVDSVVVDMTLPNNKTFHYWFPIHTWIGGDDAPTSYTFRQNDNIQVYTFSVETGDQSRFDHAGTNATITVDVCDVNDECLSFTLDKEGYDDFEKASRNTYTVFSSKKLAETKSLTLHQSNSGSHPGWYVQDVLYQHYSFPENIDHSLKDGQGFMFRQWLADGETNGTYYTTWNSNDIYATRYVKDNYGYNIVIKTKDGGSNGTDADIILTLEGCSGEKEFFNLNDDRNNFEKGEVDEFRLLGIKDLKGIKRIFLQNDGSNDGPGWAPEYIVVEPIVFNGVNLFYYNSLYEKKPFTQVLNSDDWDWESETLNCPDTKNPAFLSNIYETRPGESVVVNGVNLDKAKKIEMVLDKIIEPSLVTSRYAIFQIPDATPLGEYNMGTMVIDGTVQSVFIHVRGEKPVLDGIAISTAEPGEAFEASMRNISVSSKFYLGDILLKTLSLSNKGVFLQIPRNMENGIYRFGVESNGWDITYDETIEIVKSIVPHIASISDMIVYTGQVVEITGKNFGDDLKSMKVVVGDKEAEIKSLNNEKISIRIPSGVSGKNIAVQVIRENVPAPEILTIEIKGIPWFMSFDDPERLWTSDNADLSFDDIVRYENIGYSLKIHGDGYKSIVSPVFNTYEIEAFSRELQLDVWIPEDQINPYWYGDVQMSVNIPAAGLYNAWIGQVLLTGLQAGWNTLSFELNQDIYNAIARDYPNATITIILNTNQNPDDFRIDNLRFGGDLNLRTTEHVIAGNILDIYLVDFMSFDNINDWSVDNRDLLFVESPKTQGLGAAGVTASGFTEIKSRSFALSELKFVSNIISLDVYVPNPQPNDYWVGDIGLNLSCPDLGINSMYLGNVNLTHMFREEFNNIQFTIPEEIVMNLRYGIGECSFSIYLNVNNGAGTFLLDNMGFVNILEVAGR